MTPRVLVLAAAVLAVAAVSRAARAEDRPWAVGVSAEAQQAALALYEQGNKLFVEKKYADALKLYREAIRSWDHPAIRFNMAESLVSLEQPLEAYENLLAALAHGEAAIGAEHFERATRTKILLEGQLAHIEITCDEPGAKVSLDGQPLFVAPGTAKRTLLPGAHQIVAHKPGYVTITRDEILLPHKPVMARLELVRATTRVRRWARWKPWAVVGGGVAVGLVGVALRFHAQSVFDEFHEDLSDVCPLGCKRSDVPPDVAELEEEGALFETIAASAWALGSAAVVTGLVFVVLNDERVVESPLPAQAAIGYDGRTWSVALRF